jgi:hypothetical protein
MYSRLTNSRVVTTWDVHPNSYALSIPEFAANEYADISDTFTCERLWQRIVNKKAANSKIRYCPFWGKLPRDAIHTRFSSTLNWFFPGTESILLWVKSGASSKVDIRT